MNRLLIILLVLGATVPFALTHAQAPEAQGKEPKKEANLSSEFEGKIVTIYVTSSERGAVLTNAKLTEIGNRMMIVGTGADDGRDRWTTGIRIGIPWDNVASFYAMTKEQFAKKILDKDIH